MAAQLLEFVLLTALPGMLAWGPACDQIDDDVLGPQVAPYRFNAEKGAWKAEPLDAKAPEIERDTFTMVTWNIWFGDVQVMNRLEALANTIAALDPDFVALQEVTQPILHELLLRPWARKYYVSDSRGWTFGDYGSVLLSRFAVQAMFVHDLPSRLDRKLVCAMLNLTGGRTLCVATSHLESYTADVDYRRRQMDEVASRIKHATYGWFAGDTNFQMESEDSLPGALGLRDVWTLLHPDLAGLTQTHATAAMTGGGNFKPVRLDRVFLTPSVNPVSIELLGTQPIAPVEDEGFAYGSHSLPAGAELYPSDHYGLHFRLVCADLTATLATSAAVPAAGAATAAALSSPSSLTMDAPTLLVCSDDGNSDAAPASERKAAGGQQTRSRAEMGFTPAPDEASLFG